jgi:hypothetical protein
MAILAADAPFSKSPLQGAMAHTDKHGFKVVSDARYPLSTRDLAPFIRSLKPIDPDILFLAVESRIRHAHLSSCEGETERMRRHRLAYVLPLLRSEGYRRANSTPTG